MKKIRHIAISSQNPAATAKFYKEAFGWEEISRSGLEPDHEGDAPRPSGVIMSDGSINITILKFGTDQIGKGVEFEGVHHMGVVVDDQDQVFIVDSQRNRIQIYRKIPPFFVGLYDGGRL